LSGEGGLVAPEWASDELKLPKGEPHPKKKEVIWVVRYVAGLRKNRR